MSLKKNVVANYFGQAWRLLMSLAFVPLYIKYLGIEAYGLIGIFVMLQAWLSLLDLGMKPTLVREMARFTGGNHDAQSIWDLLRSLEIVVVAMAFVVGFAMWMSSEWLASNWIQTQQISTGVATTAFIYMGLVIALRLVENIYAHSIAGLQRQVLQNLVISVMETFRAVGAVAVLAFVDSTITTFFIWQGITSVVTVFILMLLIYRLLPKAQRFPRFSLSALKKIWRFAAGMFGITLLAILLTQVDKILLSRSLLLRDFGYYALASLVVGGLHTMVMPIGTAFFPRFTELLTRGNNELLIETYHLGAQLVTVVMGSAIVTLVIFAEWILLIWTADAELASQVAPILRVLAVGTFLNGLMQIPYQMQLAHGWTSLIIRINVAALFVFVPAIFWVVPVYGAVGAAWVWVLLNLGYCLIGVNFMYRRILSAEKWKWYFVDVLIPLLTATGVGFLIHFVFWIEMKRIFALMFLGVIIISILLAAAFTAPSVRRMIFEHLRGQPKGSLR